MSMIYVPTKKLNLLLARIDFYRSKQILGISTYSYGQILVMIISLGQEMWLGSKEQA